MKKFLLIICSLFAFSACAEVAVKDHTGTVIKINSPLKKVVVLNSSNLEMFLAAGGMPVAYAKSTTTPEYVMKALEGVQSVGKVENPDIEKIVSLSPDLVIGMNFPFHMSMVKTLAGAGIKTALFSPKDPKEVVQVIRLFGGITGNTAKAEQAAKSIEKDMADVKKLTAKASKKRVLALFGSPESYSIVLPSSYTGMMMDAAGAENIASGMKAAPAKGGMMSSGFVPFNMEFIAAADPDIILLINHGNKATEAAKSVVDNNPAWSSLKAVKSGRIYNLRFETYGINPTVRTGEAVAELAKLIYPELYK